MITITYRSPEPTVHVRFISVRQARAYYAARRRGYGTRSAAFVVGAIVI
jgi:hypothetical protein